jgi:HAE1 family hydrophobic/amphiphilic exporter-1
MLGLIMLAGIVVNNGIVLIQFINDLREEGYPLREAIITGAKTRLRPILMTTATTLLGLMPLALKLEEGSEFQQPMAIAVIGGLLVSTCLTLFIIPAFYIVSESLIVSIKKRRLLG